MEVIRTLGLYQPFAGLMLHGKIETRWIRDGKKPPFPLGKYLIYATRKKYSLESLQEICGNHYKRVIDIACSSKDDVCDITGKALCIGDLVKIIDPLTPDNESKSFVKVFVPQACYRMVGLVFENVQRIKPFDFKGKQGIGFLSDADKAKIEVVAEEAPMMGMGY